MKSVQKLSDNHETIQQLTSQLQQIQEQINPMTASGDFQEVETKYCGKLSQLVISQFLVPC